MTGDIGRRSNLSREEEILLAIAEHTLKIKGLMDTDTKLEMRVIILERLLLIGDDHRKPLVELIRELDTRMSNLITSIKNKEIKEEEEEAVKLKEEKDQRTWLKRVWIGGGITFVFTVVIPSLWQIIVFWTKVYPILAGK